MAEFPGDIYDPRDIENMPGVVYDPDKKTIVYAEDVNGANEEIVAIETALGAYSPALNTPASGFLRWIIENYTWAYPLVLNIYPAVGFPFPTVINIPMPTQPGILFSVPSVVVQNIRFNLNTPPALQDISAHFFRTIDAVGFFSFSVKYWDNVAGAYIAPPIRQPVSFISNGTTIVSGVAQYLSIRP